MSSDDELAETILELQSRLKSGMISKDEFSQQMEFLKKKFELSRNNGKDTDEDGAIAIFKTVPEKDEGTGSKGTGKTRVIEGKPYRPKTTKDLNDIEKRIDRLSPENVDSLKERYLARYGEELVIPDIYEDHKDRGLIVPSLENADSGIYDVMGGIDSATPDQSTVPEGLETSAPKKEGSGFGAIFKRFRKKDKAPAVKATFELVEDDKPVVSEVEAESVEADVPGEKETEGADVESEKKSFEITQHPWYSFKCLLIREKVMPEKKAVAMALLIPDIPLWALLLGFRVLANIAMMFIVFDDEDDDGENAVVAELAE